MQKLAISLFLVTTAIVGHCQNLDSLLATPKTLNLSISTPQPRLGQQFKVWLDISFPRAQFFRSMYGKLELADPISATDNDKMMLTVNALKKGPGEIGPLEFTINNTKYSTNTVKYEVINELPDIEEGLWMRKVTTGDSSFCIIIEQRIPAKSKKTTNSTNSTTYTFDPLYSHLAKFKDSYSIAGLSGNNSYSDSEYQTIDNGNGQKTYLYSNAIYYFIILDKTIKIEITKDKLENIPTYFKFENITIQ